MKAASGARRLRRLIYSRTRAAIVFALIVCCAAGCRRAMFEQARLKPLERSDFFPNAASARPSVPHTVARGHLENDEHLYAGSIGTNLVETFPISITRETLLRGRERFDIYCSVCHGRTGE